MNTDILNSEKVTPKINKLLNKFKLNNLNLSITNSIENTSFIILKDGTIKQKRHKNSYLEEYLDNKRLLLAMEASEKPRKTKSYINKNKKKNLFYKTNFYFIKSYEKNNNKNKRNSDNDILGKLQRLNMFENVFINDTLNKELNNREVQYRFSHNNYSNNLNLSFLYNDENIKSGIKKRNNSKISNFNKNNIIIIVFNLKNKKEKEEFKQIICPECKEISNIYFIEDKITIKNCINKHNKNLSINEFIKKQYINEIKCNICKNDKSLYNDKIYICSCKQYICPLCARNHDNSHNMIEYNNRFYKCLKHNNNYISYCNNCNMNLCEKCEENHDNEHKRVSYKEKKPNEKKINEIKKEIKI